MNRRAIVSSPKEDSIRSIRAPWRLVVVMALVATLSGILLAGVSSWFLAAVALAGLGPAALTFNIHVPSAFVRLFALSRTAFKYGERVVGHRAALLDQAARRAKLLTAMAAAPSTRATSWQLAREDRLCAYMDDVEDVDYARLRTGVPTLVLSATAALLAAATAWFEPLALAWVLAWALAVIIAARMVIRRAGIPWRKARECRCAAARSLGTSLSAVVPLKGEGFLAEALRPAFAEFVEASASSMRLRKTYAALDALAGIAGPCAAIGVFVVAWSAGARGAELLVPALLAFAWLALGETAQNLSRVAQGKIRETAAREALDAWRTRPDKAPPEVTHAAGMSTLALRGLPRQTVDGRCLGEAISTTLTAGHPTALVGVSGSGKTTLLKEIAGWLGTDHAECFSLDETSACAITRRVVTHLCLHDAAVLSDTIRENLFAPGNRECWEALAIVELDEWARKIGGLDAWISQDQLSLGEAQRINLARALLCSSPIVLLDEPTEHLDCLQGRRILKRLLARLADRIIVYATHDEVAAQSAARLIRL
jgi:ATP-binding cassette, subfamily C, bacterial CydC